MTHKYEGLRFDGDPEEEDLFAAARPYAGTSGWSGSEASRLRAEERDRDGRTGTVQWRVLQAVRGMGQNGMTIAMLRHHFPEEHHGTLSGALTALHKTGMLMRLTEMRHKCSVYVAPQFLLGREVVPPKVATKGKQAAALEEIKALANHWVTQRASADAALCGINLTRILRRHGLIEESD